MDIITIHIGHIWLQIPIVLNMGHVADQSRVRRALPDQLLHLAEVGVRTVAHQAKDGALAGGQVDARPLQLLVCVDPGNKNYRFLLFFCGMNQY